MSKMNSKSESDDTYESSGDRDDGNDDFEYDETNVFIKYIPKEVTDTGLYSLFSEFGEIVSCKVMVDVITGNSLGYGFCRFSSHEEASAAIKAMDGKEYGNNVLLCKFSNSESASCSSRENRNLYIKSLPLDVDEEFLESLFHPFGEIETCKVITKNTNGNERKIGFVKFYDIEDAKDAKDTMNGFNLEDCSPLVVKFAETLEEKESRREKFRRNHGKALSQLQSSSPVPFKKIREIS
eukprot:TRINITY_DN12377_c0_g1_i1.p1 TRINITY_DN12377_c0_g1~~TRINITY_DN12377_c0_g1_i1.p1  ORF type:complete len:238 (+),score=52.60 TRINITY_DN12377_c0_g1_i1:63-776(+)